MEDTHLRLLRLIEARPDLSQRDLPRGLGISLGKINYCLEALVDACVRTTSSPAPRAAHLLCDAPKRR